MASILDDDQPLLTRPAWPFYLGSIGGATLAIASLVLAYGSLAESPGALIGGAEGFVVGTAILAVAWLAAVIQGRGTLAPFFGCVAVLGAAAIAWSTNPDNTIEAIASARAVIYALAAFAVTLVFARGLVYVRAFAVLAAPPAIGLAVAVTRKTALTPEGMSGLLGITFVMFAIVGGAIAISLPGWRRA